MNHEWAELREKAEAKRDELNSAHGVQTFHIECRETLSWIEDKKRILQSTDSLEMDLTGIMTLQVSYTIVSVHIDNFTDFIPYILSVPMFNVSAFCVLYDPMRFLNVLAKCI